MVSSYGLGTPVPKAVPTVARKLRGAGISPTPPPEMMTDDAKFALGF